MAVARNNIVITFPTPSAEWDVTHWGLFLHSTDNDPEDFALGDNLGSPQTIPAGSTVTFPISNISITIPNGDATNVGSDRAVDGFIAGTLYLSLHGSNPGSTGAGEISGGNYSREPITSSQWAVTAS